MRHPYCFWNKNKRNNLFSAEFVFIYGEKHSLSLRLTFCLSPQTQIIIFYFYKSNAFQSVYNTLLQIITTHKNMLYISLFLFFSCCFVFYIVDQMSTRNERLLHPSVLKNQVWFKMFVTKPEYYTVCFVCTVVSFKYVHPLSWHTLTIPKQDTPVPTRTSTILCTDQKSLWFWF